MAQKKVVFLEPGVWVCGGTRALPTDPTESIDLDKSLALEFYKLEQTFHGAIGLEAKPTDLPAPEIKLSAPKMDEKRSLLDEVEDAINERYQGDFTEADRVIIGDLLNRLLKDAKLRKIAKFFEKSVQEAYTESTERFTKRFEDRAKYIAIMNAVGAAIYRECRNAKK